MPKMARTNRGIDLTAPGGIEALLAFHRAHFGAARMEEAGADAAAAKAAADKAAADASGAKDKGGFPENTPLTEMTAEQREAYWKDKAQKHESRSKKFDGLTDEQFAALKEKASKHDQLERELMSDKDKAVAEALDKARAEATPRVVRAEFKAAAKGVLSDEQLAALLEDRDLSKYVNAQGEPDEAKITKLVTAFAPQKPGGPSSQGLGRPAGAQVETGSQGRAQAEKRFGAKK